MHDYTKTVLEMVFLSAYAQITMGDVEASHWTQCRCHIDPIRQGAARVVSGTRKLDCVRVYTGDNTGIT